MPQAKHTFVESKMNKDLDDRLLSGGQYRNAVNIAVSKSDDSNVGALENVLGNYNINNFFPNGYNVPVGIQVIGSYFNTVSDDIFVFLTNFIDPANPNSAQQETKAYVNSSHFINVYNVKTTQAKILVTGVFLNFSINNRVLGVDVAEDFLFWTDNRNQPRKINWKTASSNPNYYNTEDTISIVKYAPFMPIKVQDETVIESPIEVSTATSMNIEVYNTDTDTYEFQDVIEYLGDNTAEKAARSPYSQVSITNGGTENIPLYTYFELSNNTGGESGLFQVMAKEFSATTGGPTKLYTWPRISTNTTNWDKITFYNLNMKDATSSHLPPSARIKFVTEGGNITQGNCLYDQNNSSMDVFYLNGGTGENLGSGYVGDNNPITDQNKASKYGLPLGLFGSLVARSDDGDMSITNASDFHISTGLKTGNKWTKTRIISNTLVDDTAQACFLINTDPTTSTSESRAQSSYGIPDLTNGDPDWNVGFDKDLTINKGQHYFDFCFPNPNYNPDWAGDGENLKEKFVRFAYRFKFDDGEYSLISPFTQPLFIPEQDGFFIDEIPTYNTGLDARVTDQLLQAGEDTIVKFMENKCNDFKLDIPLEYPVNELNEKLKITEIDILYKESDGLIIKLIETIDLKNNTDISNNSTNTFSYSYQSSKPFKNLPTDVLVRTSDKAPIKALSQAISGNRVIYGNFVDKHGSPNTLDYETSVSEKTNVNVQGTSKARIQYPNHTVKQNRTYQVGVVLADRYGRQTDVILSPPKEELTKIPRGDGTTLDFGDSTIYHKYKPEDYNTLEWVGDSLKLLFNSPIPSSLPSVQGYPGLYNGDPTSDDYNPLGFYSYKIVVKQKEQDYYNVYVPSLMLGQPAPPQVCIPWGGPAGSTSIIEYLEIGDTAFEGSLDVTDLEVGMIFTLFSCALNGIQTSVAKKLFTITEIDTSGVSDVVRFSPPIPPQWNISGNELRGALGSGTQYPVVNGQQTDSSDCFQNAQCFQQTEICFSRPGSFDGSFLSQTMTTTLLGDNINKVPADLTEVRANQAVYGSSDLGMIPRVATSSQDKYSVSGGNSGTCNYTWTAQVNPGTTREVVTMLGNWNDIVSQEYKSNLYEEDKNPVVAIMSNSFRLGVVADSKQYLAVFETEPTVSNLDIFWETSTTGLISELNEDIASSDDPALMAVNTWNQTEGNNYDAAEGGTPSVVLEVSFKDANGDSITTLSSVILLSVTDSSGLPGGQPNVLTSEYDTNVVFSAGLYQIKAIKNCVFRQNQEQNDRIFTFQTTTTTGNTAQWSTDGSHSIANELPTAHLQFRNPNNGVPGQGGFAGPPQNWTFPPQLVPQYMQVDINPGQNNQTVFDVPNKGAAAPLMLLMSNGSAADFGETPNKWIENGVKIEVQDINGNVIDASNPQAGFFWKYWPGCQGGCINNLNPYPYYFTLEFEPNNAPSSLLPANNSQASNVTVYIQCTAIDAATGGNNFFETLSQPLVVNSNSMTNNIFSTLTAGGITGRLEVEISNSSTPITTWNCNSGTCVEVSGTGGTYVDLQACVNSGCQTTTYDCVNGVCTLVQGSGGAYADENACLADCGNTSANEPKMNLQFIGCHSGGNQKPGYSEPFCQFNPYQYENILNPNNGSNFVGTTVGGICADPPPAPSTGFNSPDADGCVAGDCNDPMPKALGFGITHKDNPGIIGPNGSVILSGGGASYSNNGLNFANPNTSVYKTDGGRCEGTGASFGQYGFGPYPNGTGISAFNDSSNNLPMINQGADLGNFAIATSIFCCPCMTDCHACAPLSAFIQDSSNNDINSTGYDLYFAKWGIAGPATLYNSNGSTSSYAQGRHVGSFTNAMPGLTYLPNVTVGNTTGIVNWWYEQQATYSACAPSGSLFTNL